MKVILDRVQHGYYSEANQSNPLRFYLLERVSDETFKNTTNEFKCKDYFNDFLTYKHFGTKAIVYGMPWESAKFDSDGGLYVLCVNTFPDFAGNIKRVIEPTFTHYWGSQIEVIEDNVEVEGTYSKLGTSNKATLLYFSPECFQSTFVISTLTLFLRNCNFDFKIPSYEDRLDATLARDGHWYDPIYTFFKEHKYKNPITTQYVYHTESGSNDLNTSKESIERIAYAIHDGGLYTWIMHGPLKEGGSWPQSNPLIDNLPVLTKAHEESYDWDEDEECYDEEETDNAL